MSFNDIQQRINFYLAPDLMLNREARTQKLSNKNFDNVYIGNYENIDIPDGVKKIYIDAIQSKLSEYNINNNLMLLIGDVTDSKHCYALSKTRSVVGIDNRYSLLKCLNYNRHWGENVHKIDDTKFENKTSKIVWRGTTTGFPVDHYMYRGGDRFTLVTKYFNETKFADVGFTYICQEQFKYSDYIKNTMQIEELRNFKYILSLEGNDKDSGINWKLKSNSVVFMPKPKISSWLMEETLLDGIHYIRVNDDFSDLQKKYEWCEKNQDACIEIINNANIFMSMFDDEKQEEYIEKSVIESHLKYVEYI